MTVPVLILASASPRRSQLLEQIGVAHRILPVDADETPHANETPEKYVVRVATEKARHGWERCGGELPVLAADTAVVLAGAILGKPRDEADAVAMLRALSGREHRVLSAVALCFPLPVLTQEPASTRGHEPCFPPLEKGGTGSGSRGPFGAGNVPGSLREGEGEQGGCGFLGNRERTALSISRVRFRALGDDEIRAYCRTGEPRDKAGAYAIQGVGAVFVEQLEGSYSGVMGLPLFETARLLQAAGVHLLPESES
ncbi:MAG TPA: Maf family protein [Methylococcaceae bacterium]|nr:Maf family protein [Methylococcaceae bacterium]